MEKQVQTITATEKEEKKKNKVRWRWRTVWTGNHPVHNLLVLIDRAHKRPMDDDATWWDDEPTT